MKKQQSSKEKTVIYIDDIQDLIKKSKNITTITKEQLEESRSTINSNMQVFREELRALEIQSIEESSGWIIR